VERLHVADGVVSGRLNGREVLDVHCAAHPESRNRGNGNMLSVVFTGHYELMQQEFGQHLVPGIAGENILVECAGRLTLDDVQGGLAVRGDDGGLLEFGSVSVAHPCVEFSRFSLDDLEASPKDVSRTLRFLDAGTRGFYCVVTSELPAAIHIGDELLVRS
jgi:MOSC domain-containing protein YiiM